MKRIAGAVLGLLLAGSVQADLSAKLYLTASLDDQTGNGFVLDSPDQQYNTPGMLHVSADGKAAGFSFNLYTAGLNDEIAVKLQKAVAWLRPIPPLKLSAGGVGLYTYTEQLSWWKDPNAATWASAGFDNNVGSDSKPGASAEWTGVPGLTVAGIVAPGYDTAFGANNGANAKAGGLVKAELKGFGSAAAAFRYDGRGGAMFAHIGADLTAVPNLYAFVNANLRNDNNTLPGLDGVAIDWYAKYTLKDFSVQLAAPVTFRLTGLAGDVNYLSYQAKVAYDLPAVKFTPYVQAQQDRVSLSDPRVLPQVNVGTSYNGLDNASLDISFQGKFEDGTWKIPVALNLWY